MNNNRPDDNGLGDNVRINSASPSRQRNPKEFDEIQSPSQVANLVDEGILAGQRIAKISVVTLIGIGIVDHRLFHLHMNKRLHLLPYDFVISRNGTEIDRISDESS